MKLILFDPNGFATWSTDSANLDITKPKRKGSRYWNAVEGEIASEFVRNKDITDLDGGQRSLDIVETYMPLTDTYSGQVIGVLELYRDVGGDVALQVKDARSSVLWATVATMGGLFIVLLGFIVTADVTNYRSNRRALSAVEHQLAERTRAGEELQRARDEAVEANRAKSEFLSRMSHELRTPLNAIIGMADLLSESELNKEERRYVRVLARAGDGLATLVNDILDLSKVEARQLNFEKISFDLDEVVEDAASFLAIRAHENGLELNSHVTSDMPTAVVGDPVRLRQVLFNLMGNAIKFTEKGEVELHVEADPESNERGHVLFRVSDTGIGIPQDRLESVFESFTQVDASTTRKFGGTGLGLAICTRLVELMGGRIWVESRVGEGSTFYFTARFETQAEPSRREALPGVDLTRVKTLVVDDNATNRMILREMLAVRGAVVTEAEDGLHALAELDRARNEEKPYQLVLLDQRMPEMDGYQVAQQIKDNPRFAGMTILMLTSDSIKGDIKRSQELGISGHLAKPVSRSELLAEITTAMGLMEDREGVPKSVQGPALPGGHSALSILLVEDNEDNRFQVESYLKETACQLDVAENGEVGVSKFKSGTYDLVLMDIQMPVMDGYTATRVIRKWEKDNAMRTTPIIAFTAHALKEEVIESLEAGCTGHISKPVKKAHFLEAISEYTDGVKT